MRIAVVMPRGGRMDADRLNSMEVVALTLGRASGYRATTVFICEEGAQSPAAPDMTLHVPGGLNKAAHARAVLKALRTFGPDLVEFHQQLETSAKLARRLAGVKTVLYRHTRIRPPRHRIDRLRYQSRLAAFDRIVLVSHAARAEFTADYPRFQDWTEVISNPIEIDAWTGDVAVKERLILFAGRATQEKGLDAFCLALAGALDAAPDWRGVLLLGDWDRHAAWAEPHVRSLDRFGARVQVVKSASISVVQEATRRAAIAVTPSRVAEALGLSALEAHAAGAALISSGRGGLREVSGPHACYVDPPEAALLLPALLDLIHNDDRRRDMARQGQAYVIGTHNPERRVAELDLLREAIINPPIAAGIASVQGARAGATSA